MRKAVQVQRSLRTLYLERDYLMADESVSINHRCPPLIQAWIESHNFVLKSNSVTVYWTENLCDVQKISLKCLRNYLASVKKGDFVTNTWLWNQIWACLKISSCILYLGEVISVVRNYLLVSHELYCHLSTAYMIDFNQDLSSAGNWSWPSWKQIKTVKKRIS